LRKPSVLTFDGTDDLFVRVGSSIYEYTPGGAQSTFASGLNFATFMAFQPVPEPSALGLLAVGTIALVTRCRRK
jgi:hypothetical protein